MSDQVEGETCQGVQADGSCESIEIPDCEDRNVYCNELPALTVAELTYSNIPDPAALTLVDTSVNIKCTEENWHFDYAVQTDFVSFHYSNNINELNLTCTEYGY